MSLPSTAVEPGLRSRLADLADAVWPEVRSIAGLARLTGGTSREHWAFDAVCDAGVTPLVLRRATAAAAGEFAPPAVEVALLRLARRAGVPGPQPMLSLRPQNGLGEGFLMERVPGAPAGPGALPPGLARRCGQVLARIHHIPLGALPPLRPGPATVEIARCRAQQPGAGARAAVVESAFEWLQRQAPGAPIKPALVHGAFRPAKLRVDGLALRAVLDWKQAHLGDPMEDLGALCLAACDDDRPPRGADPRAELYAGYEDAGGRVDPERIHYWEVFGTLQRTLASGDTARLRRRLGL